MFFFHIMPQYRIWDTPILKKTHELYSLFQIFLGENIATGIPTDYNVDEDIDDYQALFYNTDETSKTLYRSVVIQRAMLLTSFLFILIAGVTVRIYLDGKTSISDRQCPPFNETIHNITYLNNTLGACT